MAATTLNVYDARVTYAVAYRTALGDAWTPLPGAYLDSITTRVAPGFSSAVITYHQGRVATSAGAVNRARLDLHSKWVRVTWTDGTAAFTWYGYCPTPEDTLRAKYLDPDNPSATLYATISQYLCYGLEQLLDERPVERAWTAAGLVERPLPFNLPPRGRNITIAGNRAQAKSGGIYKIDSDPATGGDTFTALDLLEHLAALFAAESGLTVTIAGQSAALAYYTDAWDPAGRSYWQTIQSVVNPGRGYILYPSYAADGLGIVLNIGTTVQTDVLDADGVTVIVPASARQLALNLADAERIAPTKVSFLAAAHRIVVRGEPLRVCFTMNYGYNSLDQGWAAADETAYNAAAVPARLSEAYADVYTRFTLPDDWGGYANAENCLPVIDPDTGLPDATAQQTVFTDGLVLDSDLPLRHGDTGQPRPILAVVAKSGTYTRLTHPEDATKPAAALQALDDQPGVRLTVNPRHLLGLNHSAITAPRPTYDWQELYLTVAMPTNERARLELDLSTPAAGVFRRTRYIDIPDAHVWYVVPGTVLDAFSSSLVLQGSSGNVIRDDTAILRRIAYLAKAWYGQKRTLLQVDYKLGWLPADPSLDTVLGYLVTETDLGTSVEPTGTVITELTWRFAPADGHTERQTVALRTEYRDLEIPALYRPATRSSHRGRRSGYRYPAEATATNYPAALPAPYAGSGGGAGGLWAVITSASTGPTGHLASIWTQGYYNGAAVRTPDLTGQALRLPGLAAGQTPLVTQPYLAILADDGVYEAIPEVARA